MPSLCETLVSTPKPDHALHPEGQGAAALAVSSTAVHQAGDCLGDAPDDDWNRAERIAFRAFANGYMREIDAGRLVFDGFSESPFLLFDLPNLGRTLRAELRYRSLCGTNDFGSVEIANIEGRYRPIDRMAAIQGLIAEASHGRGDAVTAARRAAELVMQVVESTRAIAKNLEGKRTRINGRQALPAFVEAEQSVSGGHWLHPAPKSMDGIADWQRAIYGPEAGRSFRLVAFAADRDLVREAAAYGPKPSELALEIAGRKIASGLSGHEALLLMHPLQAQHLLLKPELSPALAEDRLRCLGEAGPPFFATSSMRTVYSPDARHMLKFSLPVRITNSIRKNGLEEMRAGAAMAAWLRRAGQAGRRDRLTILPDPAWTTLAFANGAESGFETIYRDVLEANPDGTYPTMIAALLTSPDGHGRSRLARMIAKLAGSRDPRSLERTARQWFAAYLASSLDPLVSFFDQTGIALEAHQQNALLKSERGWPCGLVYRDNQGFYLTCERRDEIAAQFPEALGIDGLFFGEAEIVGRMSYYLVVNQIFAVIARLGEEGLLREEAGLSDLRDRLERLHGETVSSGRRFCDFVLESPELVSKANLGLRLAAIDELAAGNVSGIYGAIANPIAGLRAARPRRVS
ncbi:IucA/IucC family protein [Fulvimarina sp. MAC3]|uniref:IucA/IucC family protein n=1 Tax=Fulvimarina sp. MAC3 TaxID=3148887 RepID=UPI0031FE3F4A